MKSLFLHRKVFASVSALACLHPDSVEDCMGDGGPGARAACVGAGRAVRIANSVFWSKSREGVDVCCTFCGQLWS